MFYGSTQNLLVKNCEIQHTDYGGFKECSGQIWANVLVPTLSQIQDLVIESRIKEAVNMFKLIHRHDVGFLIDFRFSIIKKTSLVFCVLQYTSHSMFNCMHFIN